MTTKRDCSGKIWGDYRDVSGRIYRCSRNATVQRDGKWYCWQHDPERVKADEEKRRAGWEAKRDRQDAKYARLARNARLGKLVTVETAKLLEALASDVDKHRALGFSQIVYSARALAARIREALEVNDEG